MKPHGVATHTGSPCIVTFVIQWLFFSFGFGGLLLLLLLLFNLWLKKEAEV